MSGFPDGTTGSRGAGALPYWSPASKYPAAGTSSSDYQSKQTMPGQLVSSAAEFVPGGFPRQQSVNGMNSMAAEWKPTPLASPSRPGKPSGGGSAPHTPNSAGGANGTDIEPMVEVTWNGSTFFVPESMGYAYEGGVAYPPQPEDDMGLDWTMGSQTAPAPPKRCLQTIGIPEPIRNHFQSLDTEALRQMQPDDEIYKEIPPRYHSVFLLDDPQVPRGSGGSFGYPSSLFKVVDRSDSQIYALRRFENVRTSPTILKNALTRWYEVRHPGIVQLYSISQERGALFFTHAYYPAAQTLKQRFIDQRGPLLNEALMWRLLAQLLSGLRLVHSRNMALRVVSPVHVLLTSGTVARFNCIGVEDVLEFESRKTLMELQIDDIVKMGYLMLSLASRTLVGPKNAEQAMALLQRHFSADMRHVVGTMLSGKSAVSQICHLISERMIDEYDSVLAANDAIHSNIRNEYENGRMLRLLLKLGFVNERPEYARAPQWSETGDRYVLKLFRDYVFHQTISDGSPVIDAGHVVTALNKLDTGDSEQILLSSRDGKDLLVVSFADVRRCLEAAFTDLDHQAEQARHAAHAAQMTAGSGGGAGGGGEQQGY